MLSRARDMARAGRALARLAALSAAIASASLVGAPLAAGAEPKRGGHYSDCTSARCSVGFAVTRDGRSVRGFSVYARCTPAPPAIQRMRIAASGAFGYRGTMRVGSRRIRVEVSGRFVSRRLAKGTVRYRGGGCDTRTLPFRATLD